MEQARMLLAIVLSFLVFMVWNYFFVEKPEETPVSQPPPNGISRKADPEKTAPSAVPQNAFENTRPSEEAPVELPQKPVSQSRQIVVDTPIYKVTLSESQACFKQFMLKQYREAVNADSDFKELIHKENQIGTILTSFMNKGIPDLQNAVYTASVTDTEIVVADRPITIAFSWQSATGIIVTKTYTFTPNNYLIDLDVTIANQGSTVFSDTLELSLNSWISKENERAYGFEGPGALINNKLETVDVDDIPETPRLEGEISWISIQDRYFISSLIPKTRKDAGMILSADDAGLVKTSYLEPSLTLTPGQQQTFRYQIFMGPKSVSLLKSVHVDLDQAVHFGFFDFIAKPCLWLMNYLYRYIPNYGVAIIILTILIKILFWPLGNKSYKSMNEMKKLQPLMAEIREKYKDDKQRMNQEVMNLYKTYKINPLGGCLPMIAQIPVFFALYQMLYGAIELRHAPFIGWINDLSAPDRLFEFGVSIPFMQPPYGIPVLTIIMGATMLIQQKLQPPAGDPTQAKMMMMMPIVFTVIFINFSSGLVLYWLVNNILSIAQQYYVSRTKA